MRQNMKINKMILSSLIFVLLLLSITAISAADLNETDDISVLTDSNINEKSFTDLNTDISNANSKIDLSSDYKFNNQSDLNYANGITVNNKKFVINGNNHIIDCDNKARAFNLTKGNVEINNLIIKNAFHNSGSAINTYANLTLNNVTFINCSYNDSESVGALLAIETDLSINNCKFIDNAGQYGASISSYGSSLIINKSTFISSCDNIRQGHIYLYNSEMAILNSQFLNTTSEYSTAIYSEGEEAVIVISKTKFENLYANKTAGAIGIKQLDALSISNSKFDNVSSSKNGGAIFVDVNGASEFKSGKVLINNSRFNNCYSEFGGGILQLGGDLYILKTNFTSNTAEYDGGAIYTSHTDVEIENSRFKSNSLNDEISFGGACHFDKGDVILTKNRFENNIGSWGSAVYAYDTDLELTSNYFNNPYNAKSVYTVYGEVKKTKNNYTTDKVSFNNTDYNYNYENTADPFIIIDSNVSFEEIPEKFDLREYGWITPVKNQGDMGACWAFGNIAALESALLKYTNVTYALTTNNMQNSMLKYSKYGNSELSEGGVAYTAIAYLIDWLGISPEYYDDYDELGKISPIYTSPEDLHIQNAVIIPLRKNSTDNDLIKNALIKYGALAVSHNADFNSSAYYNETSHAQYYYGNASSNHRVCVVGWDDNYSKDNFLKTPQGDGAWIVKNSWGSKWGDGGYFYVSYYDTSFATFRESVAYIINNDSYYRLYQHDLGGDIAFAEDRQYYANEFIAEEDELVSAIGTYFNETGAKYEFTISVNDVNVYTQNGTSSFRGYETVELNKYIQVKAGDVFKITVKNMLPYVNNLRINAQKEISFASKDGQAWEDLGKQDVIALLKAYTLKENKEDKEVISLKPFIMIDCKNMTTTAVAAADGRIGKYFTVTLRDRNGTAIAGKNIQIGFNGKTYKKTTDEKGSAKLQINLPKAGTYTFAIGFLGDLDYMGAFQVAKITVKKQSPKLTTASKSYKATAKTKTLTATFKTANGKAVKGKKISFTVNGKTYTAKTNSKGVASVKVSLNKKGSYSFTVKYAGDNTFAAVKKSAKLTLK